jgi:hypothetical protein
LGRQRWKPGETDNTHYRVIEGNYFSLSYPHAKLETMEEGASC